MLAAGFARSQGQPQEEGLEERERFVLSWRWDILQRAPFVGSLNENALCMPRQLLLDLDVMQYAHGAREGDKRIGNKRTSKYNHVTCTYFCVSVREVMYL